MQLLHIRANGTFFQTVRINTYLYIVHSNIRCYVLGATFECFNFITGNGANALSATHKIRQVEAADTQKSIVTLVIMSDCVNEPIQNVYLLL